MTASGSPTRTGERRVLRGGVRRSRAVVYLATIFAVALQAGCGSSEPAQDGGASGDSGVDGTVTVGPTCPGPSILGDTRDCSEPLATGLRVVDSSTGVEVAETASDDQGHFRVGLAPGKYTITTVDGSLLATPVEVTVQSQRYSETDVLVDSGVR